MWQGKNVYDGHNPRLSHRFTNMSLGQLTFLPSFTSSEKISCGVALRCTMYNVHYDNVIVALSFNNDNILSFRSARCPGQPPCKPEIKI